MSSVRRAVVVELTPQEAYELWTDVDRWATFVDGFGHAQRIDPSWPAEGAKLVWQSPPAGRGTVTERVLTAEPGKRFSTRVFEERLTGVQTVEFAPAEEGGAQVALQLEYQLQTGGPLKGVMDALFIRRAQDDAVRRTLKRFATEAAEQAAL